MSSAHAVRAWLARSKAFLASAQENYAAGRYDVACFEADQAVQILLKAYMVKCGGGFPRTHSIRRLLGELGRLTEKESGVVKFTSLNRARIIMLEDAYLRSRYTGEGYEKPDAQECLRVAGEVMKFAKDLVED